MTFTNRFAALRWVGLFTVMALCVALVSIFFARAFDATQGSVAFKNLKATDPVLLVEHRSNQDCETKVTDLPCSSITAVEASGIWKDHSTLGPAQMLQVERLVKNFRALERGTDFSYLRADCGSSLSGGVDLHLQGKQWDDAYEECQLEGEALTTWQELAHLLQAHADKP